MRRRRRAWPARRALPHPVVGSPLRRSTLVPCDRVPDIRSGSGRRLAELSGSTRSSRSRSPVGSCGARCGGRWGSRRSASTPMSRPTRGTTWSRSTPRARSGHEEVYIVIAGRATFTLDDETFDAPAGTVVFIRDPRSPGCTRRGARHGGARGRREGRRGRTPVGLGVVLLRRALPCRTRTGTGRSPVWRRRRRNTRPRRHARTRSAATRHSAAAWKLRWPTCSAPPRSTRHHAIHPGGL